MTNECSMVNMITYDNKLKFNSMNKMNSITSSFFSIYILINSTRVFVLCLFVRKPKPTEINYSPKQSVFLRFYIRIFKQKKNTPKKSLKTFSKNCSDILLTTRVQLIYKNMTNTTFKLFTNLYILL